MGLIMRALTYLIIYSFLGWVVESIYKSFCEKKLVNSGFLYGPLCPIYGFGAIIMYLCLRNINSNPILVFIIGFFALTFWEYMAGVILEMIFHTKYWDYSNNKFNFQGRICLLNSVFWGILAVVFIYIIHPIVTWGLSFINSQIILYILIIAYVLLFLDVIMSIIKGFSIIEKLKHIEELNNTIKEKIEEIKQKGKGIGNKSIQTTIDELKLKKEKLAQKMYKTVIKMKRAFPTMKSEQITKFLNDRKKGGTE